MLGVVAEEGGVGVGVWVGVGVEERAGRRVGKRV